MRAHSAGLGTIADGVPTYDVHDPATSTEPVGTTQLADAVIAWLGEAPRTPKAASCPSSSERIAVVVSQRPPLRKELVGIDVSVDSRQPGFSPGQGQ